ncbi:MAG: Fic family protein [Bacilli bacterium]|nr:Fic family protein [Bacilli bacterium]
MRIYDYSFLKNGKVPANLINLLTSVHVLKNNNDIRKNNYPKIYTELEKIAIVQSVKGSNAIEGIITSDERLNAIVNQNSAPLNHDEIEIAGYRDALNKIHLGFNDISFDETNILSLHEIMLNKSKPELSGKYKQVDNVILEIDSEGKRRIRFKPTPASKTKEAMEQLILAYMEARDDYEINRLLLIPCVILDFLCIHPFSDGNGRMSRLLTLLLLYKAGFDAGKYISFEEQINKYKSYYYEALRKSSIDWDVNENDYFYFVENFLFTLCTCYKELDKRFATINSKKISKTSRIEATVLNSLTPISKQEISNILPDVSPTTIEAVLGQMMRENKIIKVGTGRNTHYIRKSNF